MNTPPGDDATPTAFVPCAPFHPAMPPPSVENRNDARPPVGSAKSAAVLLNTCPVGFPPGMLTTSACGTPLPL